MLSKNNNKKKYVKIKNKEEPEKEVNINNEINEISFIKRNLKNNTHEVIEDTKLKRITSWRKSNTKFLKNLIYNILSLGILHLISLYYPNLYIKLYCNPWPAKECDYFLVENIYGQCTLCLKIHKKNNNQINNSNNKDNYIPQSNNININPEYNIVKNLTYSFIYQSMIYEYNEETNEIIPVYIDLSKMTNKKILEFFSEGLSTENIVKKYRERYGKNEYNIGIKLPLLFFCKNDIPSFIIVLLVGMIECIIYKDFVSLFIKSFVILIIFILQILNLKKIIINKYEKEYTLDGDKNKIKVKRKYLLKEYNNFYVEINNSELLPGDITLIVLLVHHQNNPQLMILKINLLKKIILIALFFYIL